jgi:RNA polymerase sigma-70 factor (ECF subfamily)
MNFNQQEPNALPTDEFELIELLRAGDETAFMLLVEKYHRTMVRLAVSYVRDIRIAEEVVQDVWVGVLRGVHRFEGRSSLKTWIFRILTNCAKSRGKHEGNYRLFADYGNFVKADNMPDDDEYATTLAQYFDPSEGEWLDHWLDFPQQWPSLPEEQAIWQEIQACVRQRIDQLPPNQRAVITLRDLEGWTAHEVCTTLEISQENQRILLHRARSKVRLALEQYFNPVPQASLKEEESSP